MLNLRNRAVKKGFGHILISYFHFVSVHRTNFKTKDNRVNATCRVQFHNPDSDLISVTPAEKNKVNQAERSQTAAHHAATQSVTPSVGHRDFLRLWDSREPQWELLSTHGGNLERCWAFPPPQPLIEKYEGLAAAELKSGLTEVMTKNLGRDMKESLTLLGSGAGSLYMALTHRSSSWCPVCRTTSSCVSVAGAVCHVGFDALRWEWF